MFDDNIVHYLGTFQDVINTFYNLIIHKALNLKYYLNCRTKNKIKIAIKDII